MEELLLQQVVIKIPYFRLFKTEYRDKLLKHRMSSLKVSLLNRGVFCTLSNILMEFFFAKKVNG